MLGGHRRRVGSNHCPPSSGPDDVRGTPGLGPFRLSISGRLPDIIWFVSYSSRIQLPGGGTHPGLGLRTRHVIVEDANARGLIDRRHRGLMRLSAYGVGDTRLGSSRV